MGLMIDSPKTEQEMATTSESTPDKKGRIGSAVEKLNQQRKKLLYTAAAVVGLAAVTGVPAGAGAGVEVTNPFTGESTRVGASILTREDALYNTLPRSVRESWAALYAGDASGKNFDQIHGFQIGIGNLTFVGYAQQDSDTNSLTIRISPAATVGSSGSLEVMKSEERKWAPTAPTTAKK